MKRRQFIELEDCEWMPTFIRDGATDYLSLLQELFRPYRKVPEYLNELLRETGDERILDFCSGGGGPYLGWKGRLFTKAGGTPEIELSDRFPNLGVKERIHDSQIRYCETPVDVLLPPKEEGTLRTMFTSFHHFPPNDAQRILSQAAKDDAAIALFEVTERSFASFLRIFAFLFLIFPLTPFIRPFRFSRIFFTYIVPLIPLVVFWDGIVSCFRSYTEEEFLTLGKEIAPHYHWQAKRLPATLGASVIAFSGRSRKSKGQ